MLFMSTYVRKGKGFVIVARLYVSNFMNYEVGTGASYGHRPRRAKGTVLMHRIVFRLAECKLVSAIVSKLGTYYEPLSLFELCADAGPPNKCLGLTTSYVCEYRSGLAATLNGVTELSRLGVQHCYTRRLCVP